MVGVVEWGPGSPYYMTRGGDDNGVVFEGPVKM